MSGPGALDLFLMTDFVLNYWELSSEIHQPIGKKVSRDAFLFCCLVSALGGSVLVLLFPSNWELLGLWRSDHLFPINRQIKQSAKGFYHSSSWMSDYNSRKASSSGNHECQYNFHDNLRNTLKRLVNTLAKSPKAESRILCLSTESYNLWVGKKIRQKTAFVLQYATRDEKWIFVN